MRKILGSYRHVLVQAGVVNYNKRIKKDIRKSYTLSIDAIVLKSKLKYYCSQKYRNLSKYSLITDTFRLDIVQLRLKGFDLSTLIFHENRKLHLVNMFKSNPHMLNIQECKKK